MLDEKKSEIGKKPRADAARNREHILDAARQVFSEKGDCATFEDIVKRSGLGVGTLYRHFKNRDALFEAVYFSELEKLANAAVELEHSRPPLAALREFMLQFVDLMAKKYTMRESFTALVNSGSETYKASSDIIIDSMNRLATNAEKNGDIRLEFEAIDLLRALSGVANAGTGPNWVDNARRMVDVLLQGIKVPK